MTKILAVIHHRDDETTLANAEVARMAGCTGVVLIQMQGRDHEIDGPAVTIKRRHPEFLVVANRLSATAGEAIARDMELGLDGSWSDDQLVTDVGPLPAAVATEGILGDARLVKPDFLFFASVAFKTHATTVDPVRAARQAARFPWVVTTSGPATGSPPSAEKLREMADAIGTVRLAVASGIDPVNAPFLLPHVGWALVATGIGRDFHNLDADKTASLTAIAGTI